MKFPATVLSMLLLAAFVSAQSASPAPKGIPPCHDTLLTGKNAAGEETVPGVKCPHGKRLFPGHGMYFKTDETNPENLRKCCPGFGNERRRMCAHRDMRRYPLFHHFRALKACGGILLLGILFWGIMNILLTVIVLLDMTKNGRINGLWIPVLLIAGIPGSIIYALFRIGDRIQSKDAGIKS